MSINIHLTTVQRNITLTMAYPRGQSAYEVARANGFVGTEEEWLASLEGAPGAPGEPGQPGEPGSPGSPGEQGPAGPAPSGTGWVRVVDGALEEPREIQSADVGDATAEATGETLVKRDTSGGAKFDGIDVGNLTFGASYTMDGSGLAKMFGLDSVLSVTFHDTAPEGFFDVKWPVGASGTLALVSGVNGLIQSADVKDAAAYPTVGKLAKWYSSSDYSGDITVSGMTGVAEVANSVIPRVADLNGLPRWREVTDAIRDVYWDAFNQTWMYIVTDLAGTTTLFSWVSDSMEDPPLAGPDLVASWHQSDGEPVTEIPTFTALQVASFARHPLPSGTAPLVAEDHPGMTNARTPTAHTHAIGDTTGLQTALDGKARGIEPKSANFTAVVGGRYQTTAALTVTDPTTRIDGSALQNGDSYEVWIGGGNATIGGTAYAPSRISMRRAYLSNAWTTPVPFLSQALDFASGIKQQTRDNLGTTAQVFDFLYASAPSGATGGSGSWTWTPPTGWKSMTIEAVSSGGGAGSGRRGAAGTNRYGGGGGAGGAYVVSRFASGTIPAGSLAIAVGLGGAGGASVTADDTNGNAGSPGVASTVQISGYSGGYYLSRPTNNVNGTSTAGAGGGGTASAGTAGAVTAMSQIAGATGGAASVSGNGGGGYLAVGGGGGGAGGSIDSADTIRNAGASYPNMLGIANSENYYTYSVQPADNLAAVPGPGGPGGGSSKTGAATAGRNGAAYGGGGGGGGASLNGYASGAGGNGGPGIVRITCYF